jgi:hypothetical protein
VAEKVSAPAPVVSGEVAKRKISPTERWLLISKNVYARAQKRGFVGGDLAEDLTEAARDIDKRYSTDVQGLLKLTDPVEMVEQFRNLFAGYGFGRVGLDRLLQINRGALEKLAATNRLLLGGGKRGGGSKPLQDAAEEAIRALQSFSRGFKRTGVEAVRDERPAQAIGSVLSQLKALADTATGLALPSRRKVPERRSPQDLGIYGAVVKAFQGMTPVELAEAPPAALRGISGASGELLQSAFGFNSIRDMVASRIAERAAGIVVLAEAELEEEAEGTARGRWKSPVPAKGIKFRDIADGAPHLLEGVSREQAKALQEAFGIETVRDLAESRFFRVAQAIVTLAGSER